MARKKCSRIAYICYKYFMPDYLSEKQLAARAKLLRKEAGKTRAQAAREMKVSQTSIFNAEETPEQGLIKLRIRMIEPSGGWFIGAALSQRRRHAPKRNA